MTRIRLLLSTPLVAGLVAAASLAAVPSASAAALNGELGGNSQTEYAGVCTLSGGTPPTSVPFTDGQVVSTSYSSTSTATGVDPTDTVTLKSTANGTIRTAVSSGEVTSISLSGTAAGSWSAAKGAATTCGTVADPILSAGALEAQLEVHRTRAAWAHVEVSARGTGTKEAGVLFLPPGSTGTSGSYDLSLSPRDVSRSTWVYVTPGDYMMQMVIAGIAGQAQGSSSASVSGSVKVTFVAPGAAKAPAAGTARPRVTLPAGLTCSTGRASVRLTARAVGSTVKLFVNGARKATIRKPRRARTVSLVVPRTSPVSLRAVVTKVVRVHGVRRTKTWTVSRGYHSC